MKVKKLEDNIRILEEELKAEKKKVGDMKKKVDDIKKQVECPVCFEVPREGSIFVCPNGHHVCQKCKRDSCPTCREAMGDRKSLVAVAVIERIPHDCKYVDCEENLALNNIAKHEKVCLHRVVDCPNYPKCDQRVPLSKLLTHLRRSDCVNMRTPLVINGSSGVANYELSTLHGFLFTPALTTLEGILKTPEMLWKAKTYLFDDHYFALNVRKSGDSWRFVIVMFESPEVSKDFNIEMEVYETRSPPETRLSAKIRCHPCSIDQTAAEMEGCGLIVHHKFMEEMILKEDRFNFTVSFSFF